MKNIIIHIGFHKTGTTFLQQYFERHPDVWYDQTLFEGYRETGKITEESRVNILKISEQNIVLSEEQLTVWKGALNPLGAKFQDYDITAHQSETAQHLFELYPTAKILITIRGFDTLLPSLYSQYVLNGGTQFFDCFIKSQLNSKLASLFNYDFAFSTYSTFFGKENVYVLPYELLKENPMALTSTFEKKFNIPHFDFSSMAVNRSIPKIYLNVMVFVSKMVMGLIFAFPKKLQLAIYGKYVALLFYIKRTHLDFKKGKSVALTKMQMKNIFKLFETTTTQVANETTIQPYLKHYRK
jgi:hypothetical protein